MPGSKPCGKLEAAHHDKRGNDGHIRLYKGVRRGRSPIPLEPCSDKIRHIRACLDKAERSGEVEEVPTVGTVVKIEKLENIAFYEEICKAHVGMDESETPMWLAISSHDAANALLHALEQTPFLGGKVCKVTPVAPRGVGAKRGVTVPDRTGDGRYEGGAGRSGSSKALRQFTKRSARSNCPVRFMQRSGGLKAPGMFMQRRGKRSEATEEAAHRLPIPLVGSHSVHICKGNPVKYATVRQRHNLNSGTIEGWYRTNYFYTFKFYFIIEMGEPVYFCPQFPQTSIPRAAYAQRCNRFPVSPGHTVCMILGVT